MTYTRRSLLRSTAALSAAGALGALPLLTGCTPCNFEDGIRIFFAGAWLFCADPNPKNTTMMRAISLNPAESQPVSSCAKDQMPKAPLAADLEHRFPFGAWSVQEDWDGYQYAQGFTLDANPKCADCTDVVPHSVTIDGFMPTVDMETLFINTNKTSRFIHLGNPSNLSIAWGTLGMRVISLPIPARIIPAAFRTESVIVDPYSMTNPCQSNKDPGVATTHIFEYPKAKSMTFTPAGKPSQTSIQASTDYQADFHFHTIPASDPDPTSKHDVRMFTQVLGLICNFPCDHLIFNPKSLDELKVGRSVPCSVGKVELEMEMEMSTAMKKKTESTREGILVTTHAACGAPGSGLAPPKPAI